MEGGNQVAFRIGDRTVEMTPTDRDALLARLKQLPDGSLDDLRHRIESAGTSRAVAINRVEEVDALHGFLAEWVRREKKIPQGIRKLNRGVRDELEWLLGPE